MNVEHGEFQPQKEQAEFDAGIFKVLVSTGKAGESLNIQTAQSRPRRDNLAPGANIPEYSPYPLKTDDQRKILKDAMRDELSFRVPGVSEEDRKALDEMKEIKREIALSQGQIDDVAKFKDEIDDIERDFYIARLKEAKVNPAKTWKPKIGIRNIRQEGNEVQVDLRPVSFKLYSDVVTRDDQDPDLFEMGEVTGVAAIILTKDNHLLVQFRGPKNRAYGNILGASAAGMLDGQFDETVDQNGNRHSTGTLKPIDNDYITAGLKKEAQEELKVNPEDINTRVVGIVHDELKPHHEFVSFAQVNKTADELADEGLIADEDDSHDFKEKYFAIEATPENIDKMLTQMKSPIPPTHAAGYFMLGRDLVLQSDGPEAADKWAEKVAAGTKTNYAEMDRMVSELYDQFPPQTQGKPTRSHSGYDALYYPSQQGLIDGLEGARNAGLISEELYERMKGKTS